MPTRLAKEQEARRQGSCLTIAKNQNFSALIPGLKKSTSSSEGTRGACAGGDLKSLERGDCGVQV